MIIGLTGTIGSGKGTVTKYLKDKGFVHYSSSKLLGELLEKEGKAKIRDNFSPLATSLQEKYPGGVVEKNYREKYLEEQPEHAVFEAIHRQSEARFIKSVGGVVWGVDADLQTRYQRVIERKEGEKDDTTFEDFKRQVLIEEEGGGDSARDNNIRAVITEADVVLTNDGTVEELHAQVEEALRNYRTNE